MAARALMFQGTGSSVGKSVLLAGLARALTRRGFAVRPFKPQNMSNNAAVADRGEIGRAQALQARACGVAPSVYMNPVLLKPQSGTGAQLVVEGMVVGSVRARDYLAMKMRLLPRVLGSYARLRTEADIVLVEGAGSESEINLRASDIANMGFARAADVPVVLIGDIDRGGVIASIVGTSAVLDRDDAAMICGFIVNRMRGFQPWPGAYTKFRGKSLQILKARACNEAAPPAELSVSELSVRGDRLLVGCGQSTSLEIVELQMEGKKRSPARDFIHGYRPHAGEKIGA